MATRIASYTIRITAPVADAAAVEAWINAQADPERSGPMVALTHELASSSDPKTLTHLGCDVLVSAAEMSRIAAGAARRPMAFGIRRHFESDDEVKDPRGRLIRVERRPDTPVDLWSDAGLVSLEVEPPAELVAEDPEPTRAR